MFTQKVKLTHDFCVHKALLNTLEWQLLKRMRKTEIGKLVTHLELQYNRQHNWYLQGRHWLEKKYFFYDLTEF